MILENIPLLHELNTVSIALRILLALLLGGFLGIEREQKQHPAGFRTYIVVCLGSALASITNIYLTVSIGGSDSARIPAAVISGVGFLGAGTILVTRSNHIKGLTTAAGLWCCACIGVAVGSGFYSGAIICSIVIVFSLRMLSIVDKSFMKYNKYLSLYVEYEQADFIQGLFNYCRVQDFELKNLELLNSRNTGTKAATFTIKVKEPSLKKQVIENLYDMEGVLLII